jgi:hypothetical protein
MSLKTVVKNDSTLRDCNLDESNAGIPRKLAVLGKNGGNYEITCYPNATYREFWVASDLATLETMVISTDDCVDNSEVIIEDDGSDGLKIRRVPRNPTAATTKKALLERCSIM